MVILNICLILSLAQLHGIVTKKGVIRPDSPKVLEDVFCNDTSANNYVNATTYSNGKITFNKKNMDKKMLQGKRMWQHMN